MLLQWSGDDRPYIVTGPGLARCRTHGVTYEEAVTRGQEAIEGRIEDAQAWGEPVPEPRVFADV